jgi:hypothetical protein
MRKLLLASAAIVGATSGLAFAQAPASFNPAAVVPTPNPSQGQLAGPYGAGPAANNNNNSWGIANTPTGSVAAGPLSTIYAPNVTAVPTPGTVVIRLNGRVETDLTATWTSGNNSKDAAGNFSGFKTNPLGIATYMRLYPGFDGVSANGLRYGASIELRENFGAADRSFAVGGSSGTVTVNGVTFPVSATISAGAANSPSANSSTQTVFVRRAFTYLASDKVGLVRLGQTDGVMGLFDNCIFTSQCWDAGIGNFNGGFITGGNTPGLTDIPFVWLSQAGAEYDTAKAVYLSPQVYGFDFGAEYAPNMGNTYQLTGLGVGCNQAGPTCISTTSGGDATRWYNKVAVGLRFQQTFGAVDVKAYGYYSAAGKESLTTTAYVPPSPSASASSLRYDNLSFYKFGVALTAMNFTLASDYIGGAVNGQLGMRPTGAPSMNAVVTGLTYANGPYTAGLEWGYVQSQGAAQLTGISQRNEQEFALGGAYRIAPGLSIGAEYQYIFRHQGGFNFNTGAVGVVSGTKNLSTVNAQGQGLIVATILTW